VCAAATGAANLGLYGKMPSVTYEDYVHAKLIVLWGVNPSTSGIHLVPFIKEARQAGAVLVVVDPRPTSRFWPNTRVASTNCDRGPINGRWPAPPMSPESTPAISNALPRSMLRKPRR
jgi:hypothetical protein